ncbi:MAG: branched-chain amino acid ABC transporter permease [Actinomycetota bacterium]|nr:branched-chain amino acid ABC transporter permease [Actinomycetota bacterium]
MDWGSITTNALRAAFGLEACYYALAAIGLNVHFGYTGLLNFGQAGFLAVGAYGMGISVSYFGLPLWVGISIGLVSAVVFALLLGIPTLRLRADYLAIVTIASSEILRLVFRSDTFGTYTGGSGGVGGFAGEFYRVNPYDVGTYRLEAVYAGSIGWFDVVRLLVAAGIVALLVRRAMAARSAGGTADETVDDGTADDGTADERPGADVLGARELVLLGVAAVIAVVGLTPIAFNERVLWILTVGWGLVAFTSLLVFLLMRSPWGRVLKSIREDEDAARSLGKNVVSYKMQSLVFGGVIGALGGLVLAIGTQSIQPEQFGTPITFFAYAALILGGTARVFGPIVGSMIFWALLSLTENVLRQSLDQGYLPESLIGTSQVGQIRFMLVGVGLVLLMIFRPQGIFGNRREIDLDVRR